jgi:hypothetical protein
VPVTVNVKDYGAVGNDSADDWQAITNAIAATPEGGVTVFPPGIYRVAQPVMARRNRTILGSHTPRWQYRAGSPCCLKPHSTFTGTAVLRIADKEILGDTLDNDGGRVENLAVDGNSKLVGTTTVYGVLFEGLVRDWVVDHVDVTQTSGTGFATIGYKRADNVWYFPRGVFFQDTTTYSAGLSASGSGNGYYFDNLTDAHIVNALAACSESHGFVLNNPGELKLIGSRAAWCMGDGMRINGTPTVGGFQIVGFSTDRNQFYGIRITATGTQPISITDYLARRDGANADAGGGNYAALAVIGTSTNRAVPVIVSGLTTTIGINDDATGTLSPQWGVRAQYASHLRVSGTAWGTSGGFSDAGNVDSLDISGLHRRSGSTGAVDTTAVGAQPTLAALANNGAGAPAPVLAATADDHRGSFTFGSGTAPAVGSQVSVTFARPYPVAPVVTVASGNGGSASRAPFATSVTTTGFNLAFNVAAAASQAASTYAVTYTVQV